MPTNRKTVFANNEIYHVFNRGVEKRPTFTDSREFRRATDIFDYYRFTNSPLRFSYFVRLEKEDRREASEHLRNNTKYVEILTYCLMPNHFHFLLKQTQDKGISKFIANFTNSYTKYFNTKHERVGPLFQGLFKAVHIENDEQLMHVSRYIHLNPVSSFLIEPEELEKYEWSSYPIFLSSQKSQLVNKQIVLDLFSNINKYKKFVMDYVDYSRNLERIKHLALEE